jgi:hypothetical protein
LRIARRQQFLRGRIDGYAIADHLLSEDSVRHLVEWNHNA